MKHPKTALASGAALVVIVGGCTAAVVAGSPSTTPSASRSVVAAASPAQAATHSASPSPSAVPATSAPSTPALTTSQQQAIDSARSYLGDGQGFSEQGLLQQLTSSSGEGFSTADAQFAIRYLDPDWYTQAVDSAKGYVADGQGFSRAELYNQLTSSYGEGFTAGQANYALTKVGM